MSAPGPPRWTRRHPAPPGGIPRRGLGRPGVRTRGHPRLAARPAGRQLSGRAAVALGVDEPGDARDGQHAGHVHVQPQAEEVLGRVHPQRLLEDAERRVTRHVEREQARGLDAAVVAQPDQDGGPEQVEDELIEESRVEGLVLLVAAGPEEVRDVQGPGQRGGAAEEFLVEVVAHPADGLRHQQRRGYRVHEQRHARPGPAHPPGPHDRGQRDPAPDAQAAVPDSEDPVPVMRDVLGGGQVEVDPAPDDAGRDRPERDVPDQARVAARRLPAALRDQDRQGDPDHVHHPVEVNVGRAEMKPVHWRARDVETQRHAPERTVMDRGQRPPAGTSQASQPVWSSSPAGSAA